ncbi:PQQ-binding-like beta-propeller repeat protein [Agromyces sp. SYSU K20354]|uniref:outer membrane protein assembly factor BamB family protein n=1 Tax=Agromyces cavernae TaxID=2898659 RepID=UPI001E4F98DF|nr:PQQ-binding-like beta-propeller repeat protein [Agromyces cavernae]MCD2442956.1 PQQ-binding-like beta-propeller repeat protein [Agromyces cavernae]
MSVPPSFTRRAVLTAGVAGGLVALTQFAAPPRAVAAPPAGTRITELGPGMQQYSLMSGVFDGGVAYIGSRNLEPTGAIGVDVATGTVIASTTLTSGHSVQALALDRARRVLYLGVLQKSAGQPNVYRWALDTPEVPAQPIGRIGGDRDVRDLAVAPDGTLFAVGGSGPTAPALWQFDPATGQLTSLGVPDSSVNLARAVAATDTTVYFGAGTTFGGGGSTGRAALFAYDRAAGTFTDITPAEMRRDPSIRELAVDGDRLLVSTAGSTEPTKLAAISLADHSVTAIATSIGKTAKTFAVLGDAVYCANESGVLRWRPGAGTIEQLDTGSVDLGEIWGLDPHGDGLLVVSGYGFVADIASSGTVRRRIDLGEAGAPVSPQTCMGIAVGGGFAYVGGNGGIARHSLTGGGVVNLAAPGEAKDAEVVDGVLYTGQYSSQGIWSYDPRSGEPIHRVASFPSEQNRPLDTNWDAKNGLLLVAAQADTEGGGSLWAFDPLTRASTIAVNPIDEAQLVRAVIAVDGIAYLGGDNAQKTGPRGTVVAWDHVAGAELWRVETGQPNGIAALESHGRHLFAWTIKGTLIVIDRATRAIVHTADHRALCPGFAALKSARGVIYGVSDTTLFRIDPKTFAVTVVVPGINGGWYSGPHLNVDEEGAVYTLRGRTLVRVDDLPHLG